MNATAAATTDMASADLELVQRHRLGEPEAFEEVYRRFEAMVYNLALRMTGDPDEAAEVCQETFLRVHRHLGRFRGRSSLRTWVYRVAMNCCRSRLRSRRVRQLRHVADSEARLQRIADRRRSPEDEAIAHGVAELVSVALMKLPREYREAVVLRDIGGLSYAEISAVLRLRLGTVRSRIARGRDRLRVLLEK